MPISVALYEEADRILQSLREPLARALAEAEERGAARVRETITQALSPTGLVFPSPAQPKSTPPLDSALAGAGPDGKAPKGTVPAAIRRVLHLTPGLTVGEVVSRVHRLNPAISSRSVRNTIRDQNGPFERTGEPGQFRYYNKGTAPKHRQAAE